MGKQQSRAEYSRWTGFYIAGFCLVWWAAFSISRHYLDGADMVENFAWGQEWQWGTNKHPPLFSWIVAAWFSVFPATDWAYYLLNELNVGVSLWLLALAMRRVMPPEKVLAAVVLTSLGSHFGPDSGFKYNANTAQLPFIAGYTWAMISAMESHQRRWFAVAGIFAGAALLTKYYAVVLLAAIGVGLLISLRPSLQEWFKGMVLTGTIVAILVLPHVIWSIRHGWPSLNYMHAAHEMTASVSSLRAYLIAFSGSIGFSIVSIFLWLSALYRLGTTSSVEIKKANVGINVLWLSMLLTMVAAWTENIDPVSSWMIPALMFLGWALVDLTPAKFDMSKLTQRLVKAGALYLGGVVIIAPLWELRYRSYPAMPAYALPEKLAKDVSLYYRETYKQPVEYVSGTFPLSYDLAFYAPEHPHALYGMDIAQSTWIDRNALQSGNKLVICGSLLFETIEDPDCQARAQRLFGMSDQVRSFEYRVYDPKSNKVGLQIFKVLSWNPRKPWTLLDRIR